MKHLSLFSGIGGFDLAAEWMGWENVAHCEWNSFGQYVLNNHWPNSTTHHDITKTDFTIYRGSVDILTGGFPCQPYSVAGKRKGKEDERHLWPEMLRAIREIAPRWVVGENVRGIINWDAGLVFNEVQADLEAEGYEILPFLLPAAGVNAPHERYRTWFIAYSNYKRSSARLRTVPEADGKISKWNKDAESGNSSDGIAPYTDIVTEYSKSDNRSDRKTSQRPEQKQVSGRANRGDNHSRLTSNTSSSGWKELHISGKSRSEKQFNRTSYADTYNWQNFPTQSPVCTGNDGFPTESLRQFFREDSNGVISEEEINKILYQAYGQWRNETIKAGGNAIVPQVVLQIFKAIEQYEHTNQNRKD